MYIQRELRVHRIKNNQLHAIISIEECTRNKGIGAKAWFDGDRKMKEESLMSHISGTLEPNLTYYIPK